LVDLIITQFLSQKTDLKNYLTTGRVLVLIQVASLRSARQAHALEETFWLMQTVGG